MATLEDLLKLNGVVAAGEFTADGKLVDFRAKMDMPPEMAAMTAQFCASVTMMFNTLAGAFSQLSKMNWVPQQGWMYAGGDWTMAVGNNRGVFVETAKADFNQLFQALVGGRFYRGGLASPSCKKKAERRLTRRWRLTRHPMVDFHYTPTHDSWLNKIEVWFSILTRSVLRGLSATDPRQVCQAIDKFSAARNQHAVPFEWTKAVVHPVGLKEHYLDLCN